MAVMRALIPAAETALPGDGWSIVATEAGRYGDGLRASIQLSQGGELKRCYQLRWAYPKQWASCVDEVSLESGCESSVIEAAINQLFVLIEGMLRPTRRPTAQHDESPGKGRPAIQVNGRFDREILADTVEVLAKINEPTTLFVRGSEWVSVALGALQAEGFTVPRLRVHVGEVADCVAITRHDDGNESVRPARLPFTVCQDFLAMPLERAFPPLAGIRPAPVFLPDGRLLAQEGYDRQSGLLLRLSDLQDIRDDMPVEEALRWLFNELFVDFPLVNDSIKAQLLSLMLEPFARPLIGDKTPLYLIDASTQGSGKGLLADAASVVATGGKAHIMALMADLATGVEKFIHLTSSQIEALYESFATVHANGQGVANADDRAAGR